MGSPILITGGTGFVGSHLIRFLKQRQASIAVMCSRRSSQEDPSVVIYEADLRDHDRVARIIKEIKPTQIFHLAGISAVDASWNNPRLTYEINFWGTRNVFESAMQLSAPPKILNVSTSQVYAQSSERLTEQSFVAPESPYSASKAMAELLKVEFGNRQPGGIITARPFNHSGPGQSQNFVLSAMAKQFAEIEFRIRPAKLSLGNIGIKRDFSDVRDVVEAYVRLVEEGRLGETYNVCSGMAVRLSDIITMFEEATNLRVETEIVPGKMRANEAEVIFGDHTKILAETGWSPKIPLKKTIFDLLDYWRDLLREKPNQPN